MGISDQRISQKTPKKELSAMQLFTDREDPQEAFERKLALIDDYKENASGVICYYGIGGVGKTALKTKLCHMLDGDVTCPWRVNGPIACDYASFDFGEDGVIKDARTVLTRIKTQLEKKGYHFYLFDIALLAYKNKAGIDVSEEKSSSILIEKNTFVAAAISALGAIPVVGWVSSALLAIDQFAAGVHQKIDRHRQEYEDEIRSICSMEAGEILNNLKSYFIIDMRMNMANSNKPVVIFLDTYEKYVDTLNSDTLNITDDYWLWNGPESVIRAIPGILWVIFGREKLNWERDKHWKTKTTIPDKPLNEISEKEKNALANENLEQHLLGDLSLKDANAYMKKAGINDDKLCNDLYKITNGTPLLISICIERYKSLIDSNSNSKPKLEDFGNNDSELVNRYLQNMPDYYKQMSYFLAILGSWTDEMVFKIAYNIKNLNGFTNLNFFTKERYNDYIAHSFVIKKLDGTQYLHEVVKKAYLANAGEEMVSEVRTVMDSYLLDKMKNDSSMDLSDSVSMYLDNLIKENLSYKKLYDNFEKLYDIFEKLSKQYDFKRLLPLSERFYEYVKNGFPESQLEKHAAAILAEYLCRNGKIREGGKLVKRYFSDSFELGDSDDKNLYLLYRSVGVVKRCNGDYKASFKYDQKAYKGLLNLLKGDHPDTIQALNNLAVSYDNLGDYNKSKELFEEVYNKLVNLPGEDHPDTIQALNNLASSYDNLGDYNKSKELFEEVYNKLVNLLGEDHPDTIQALNNLAVSYDNLGDYNKSKELKKRVYEKRVKLLGEDHPDTIQALNNLAVSYDNLGDYNKSKESSEEVYNKRVKVLGEDHPDTIQALNDLAVSYNNLGDYNKSKELSEEVYNKRVKLLGEDHPDTIQALNNLASSYDNLGDYNKSKELFEEVYNKRVKLLGEDHPDTIKALNNLAVSYDNLGDYNKSKELKKIVYEKRVKLLVEDHPDTIQALNNLAVSYNNLGDYNKSKELFEEVYNKRVKLLVEDHPDTIQALNNLAVSYDNLGDYNKSKELKKIVYEKRVKVLGEDHPDTIQALNGLAVSYNNLGDYNKSKELFEEVYNKRVKVLGEDHPDTIKVLNNLAVSYNNLGDYNKSKELKKKVYEKRVKVLGEDHPDTIQALNDL